MKSLIGLIVALSLAYWGGHQAGYDAAMRDVGNQLPSLSKSVDELDKAVKSLNKEMSR